jgi:hypothetical protein
MISIDSPFINPYKIPPHLTNIEGSLYLIPLALSGMTLMARLYAIEPLILATSCTVLFRYRIDAVLLK